ncbi:MAG TPA: hypothetical protein VMT57_05835 [Candidatus Thermoplasmatota archaeon]|nr:hypothetical protein [Candidatus Thermoplasmatota archaeon]
MVPSIKAPFHKKLIAGIQSQVRIVRDINEKYATPRIKMTKWVKIALLGIRIYLIVLVVILAYKFVTLVI